ncbi:hypothetical protein [Actinomyces succiniciruminis]|uniref:Uncharacterized protein n=1 Tax=Actinomyces succiniciruminis TaxID=1522002 RepID=A0A1L7RLU8_9ACTO|nr:hypothetical protein [Actinomyces succiniciruminis]CED90254.1 Hypothetical protein AAM4_0359 [Actinomyces succiniciruminis]
MPYTRAQNWVDGYDGRTPITAAALNHIEDGLAEATLTAEAAHATADGAATAEALAAVRATATSAQQTANAALPKTDIRTVSWTSTATTYSAATWTVLPITPPAPLIRVNATTFRVPPSALGAVIMLSALFSSGGGGSSSQQSLEADFAGTDIGPGDSVTGVRTTAYNADRLALTFLAIPGGEYNFWARHQTQAGTVTSLVRAFLL